MTAMTRLTLMAEGFGGGTRLAESLRMFNTRYAKRALSSRSVVIIISDGYDTGSPIGAGSGACASQEAGAAIGLAQSASRLDRL